MSPITISVTQQCLFLLSAAILVVTVIFLSLILEARRRIVLKTTHLYERTAVYLRYSEQARDQARTLNNQQVERSRALAKMLDLIAEKKWSLVRVNPSRVELHGIGGFIESGHSSENALAKAIDRMQKAEEQRIESALIENYGGEAIAP